MGFKALALARAEEVGFEPYDYSVLPLAQSRHLDRLGIL
jgi:hypothetical protein